MPEASATSIGAADGRLFRLRKTAMLSRHWRLWLSFPSPGPLPKSGRGSSWFFLHTICPCEVGADSCELVEVTAADRAAATVRGGGGNVKTPMTLAIGVFVMGV